MAKSTVKQTSQSLNKYYWWGFGITLIVLALIFGAIALFGEDYDEALPELPDDEDEIPGIDDDVVSNEELVLDENPPAGSTKEETKIVENENALPEFLESWRVYSERLFYDDGGGGSTLSASSGSATTRKLVVSKDGNWEFGSSRGKWSVAPIEDSDWSAWGITSYGPTRKIVLDGWNKGSASGPVEEEGGSVNFVWILYRVGPPSVSKPGTVHMKFGQ